MEWRLRGVLDRELDLLSHSLAAQKRGHAQGPVESCCNARRTHKFSVSHYASSLRNCSKILEQMKG